MSLTDNHNHERGAASALTEKIPFVVRPAWVVAGAVAAVILGICAILSVGSAAGLLWFNNILSPKPAVTQTAERLTAPAPTSIGSVLPTRTPFAIPTAQTPALTLSVQPGMTPDEAVKTYYQLVSQKRLDLSWSLLSEAFKQKFNCCAPDYNYTDYAAWWNSVDHVEFGSVNTVSQSSDRAVVYAEIYYVMTTGARSSVVNDPYIELVYDPATTSWQFNDKRAQP